MAIEKIDIAIIGAGLSGLSLAYFLKDTDIMIKVIEARGRIGGRIQTLYGDGTAPLEMGATWLGKKHTSLVELLTELGLKTFRQEMGATAVYEPISTSPHQIVSLPPNNDPSFRIVGGTSRLISALAEHLEPDTIVLNQQVSSIRSEQNTLAVATSDHQYLASKVISTLPPNLLASSISISPPLPHELNVLMASTHTWMGESIKVALNYKNPFWREGNMSGTIVSNVGPIPEMYAHSNYEDTLYALKGFLNGTYFSLTKEERLQMILGQLSKYYGPVVHDFVNYQETVWRNEHYTFAEYDAHVLPHQNNGHSLYHKSYLDGRLYIGGAETAESFPGYMDGAVVCARRIAKELVDNI